MICPTPGCGRPCFVIPGALSLATCYRCIKPETIAVLVAMFGEWREKKKGK